jgi:hypothetical protein
MRPEQEGGCRIERAQLVEDSVQAVGEADDDREDHGGRADDGGADEHGLGGGLEGVARAVVLFEELLALLEVGREAEVLLDLVLDAGDRLDGRELEDRLGVVGHRAVGVDGDGHRAHAQEAEGDQAEGEDGRGHHQAPERPMLLM